MIGRSSILPAAYAFLLIALAAGEPVRTVGDGNEYLSYALTLSHGNAPPLNGAAIAEVRADIAPFDHSFLDWRLVESGHRAADGRLDFVHFWLYPALAAPLVGVARVTGADPRIGFTILNIALLVTAFVVVNARAGWTVALLIMAGPILWWSNKIHPEAYIVSLAAIIVAVWRERPWLAVICAGLLAAQVPPFGVLLPMIVVSTAIARRDVLRVRAFWIACAAGVLLAALPTFYYLARFGTPSLFSRAATPHWPTWGEISAIPWDLNIGLFPNWPLFGIAVAVSLVSLVVRRRSALLEPGIVMSLFGALAVLFSAPQIGNYLHGATPGIIRYAVWLTPFAVPLLAIARGTGVRHLLTATAVVSSILCVIQYRPSVGEFAHRPTKIALWVWSHAPAWSNPLPELFAKSLDPSRTTLPVATPDCGKVLMVGRGDTQGMWPRPCAPAAISEECRRPAALCYANASNGSHSFQPVTVPLEFKYDPGSVWPRRAEEAVARLLAEVDLPALRRVMPEEFDTVIPAAQGVRVESVFTSEGRTLMILLPAEPGARVELRQRPRRLVLLDGATGETLIAAPDERSGRYWLPLPSGASVVVIAVFL